MAYILAIAGPNSKYQLPQAPTAGFPAGLWHGFIAPLVFWISLASNGIRMYETHDRGRRYDFGFLLGLGIWASHAEARNMIQS